MRLREAPGRCSSAGDVRRDLPWSTVRRRSGGDPGVLYGCTVSIDPKLKEVSGLDYVDEAEIGGSRGVLLSLQATNKPRTQTRIKIRMKTHSPTERETVTDTRLSPSTK